MEFLPSVPMIGPFVRFSNYNQASREHTVSVLVVLNPSVNAEPTLQYEAAPGDFVAAEGRLLDTYKGYTFWRFPLAVTLSDSEHAVQYTVSYADHSATHAYYVPGANQPWHWFFYSCNGFHEPAEAPLLDGIQPLWRDINKGHKESPFHVQVGGGDQIYNDPVWKISTLLDWLKIEKDQRINVEPSPELIDQTQTYYFNHYCEHFSEPEFKDALASVPYIFTWDDHDIFDGYGSYPPELQNCRVFNEVFAASRRFYCLFQQHSTHEAMVELTDCWGAQGGYNEIKSLGNSVALWCMDNRTERSREQIVASGTHEMAKQKLLELPDSVRHVVVLATVPLVFPELPAEGTFQGIQDGTGIMGLFNKTGLCNSLLNQFGEPDLLDDIIDHWTAAEHVEERKQLIHNMQEVALAKKVRVSFISGDVHSAGVGRFYSFPKKCKLLKVNGEDCEDFREDFRFMPNITSSAIGNTPMPLGLITSYNKTNMACNIPGLEPTREKMVRRFRSGNDKVFGNRNYCTVEELPYSPDNDSIENGALNFTLRGEDRRTPGKVDIWHNYVPLLTSTRDQWGKEDARAVADDDSGDEGHTSRGVSLTQLKAAAHKSDAVNQAGKVLKGLKNRFF